MNTSDVVEVIDEGSGANGEGVPVEEGRMARAQRLMQEVAVRMGEVKKLYLEAPQALVGEMVRFRLGAGAAAGTGKRGRGRGRGRGRASAKVAEVVGLVVGCRVEDGATWHKVYEVDEGRADDPPSAVHVVQLLGGGATWEPLARGAWPWRAAAEVGCVGRQLVVMWDAEYKTAKDQALQRKLGATQVPYDAFVVRHDGVKAKLYYTIEDAYVETKLDGDVQWQYMEPGMTHKGGLPILTWGYEGGTEASSEEKAAEAKPAPHVAPATPPKKRKKAARR